MLFIDMRKLIINTLKIVIKVSSYLQYWDLNNLYGWTTSQNVPACVWLKWVENKSQFNKDFIENYNEDSDKGYFLNVNF